MYKEKKSGYILFGVTLEILLIISNFSTTCQVTLVRVLVGCQ